MENAAAIAAALENVEAGLSPLGLPTSRSEDQEHPLQRLTIPGPPGNAEESTSGVNIAHKRSRSDTNLLLEQLKASGPAAREEEVTALRRPASKEEVVPARVGVVTFAKKMPRASHSNASFDARRRYSSGGGTAPNTSPAWTPTTSTPAATSTSSRMRVYRSSIAPEKLTTRDIAALDFLLGIPLEAEESIVQHGWMLQQRRKKTYHAGDDESHESLDGMDDTTARQEEVLEPPGNNGPTTTAHLASNSSHHGRWWEKWVPREHNSNNNPNALYRNKTVSPSANNANNNSKRVKDDGELELPMASTLTEGTLPDGTPTSTAHTSLAEQHKRHKSGNNNNNNLPAAPVYAPGRRLEGDEAILVQIPLKIDTVTRQKSIARQAVIREWEIQVAHGLMYQRPPAGTSTASSTHHQALLDGRLFLSAAGSYPVGVFSLKRYEPKREEAALRRQKLEARGGGGSQFVMPSRDWRGISYRALLPRKAEQTRNQKAFNRFLRNKRPRSTKKIPSSSSKLSQLDDSDKDMHLASSDDEDNKNSDVESDSEDTLSSSSTSSSEDSYIPGILDDPEMTLGRHRNVMIGDVVTGCVVASTIQFVKPALLKADLNQKFRERFDGWEPGKSQRKYIGARVVDGVYTLIDPTESTQDDSTTVVSDTSNHHHNQEPLPNSPTNATPAIIRMPPSLTLSKIRSVKRQALMAFVKAKLEVGTVALACVYFERLCLSCRVDKTNRRLCFASCLLLASKINEPNEVLVIREDANDFSGAESAEDEDKRIANTRKKIKRLQSSIRPNKRSSTMFASLLEFFTQEWSLSLKLLYAGEWGVFAALRFSLHATPSQVAFHFKRLMKTLEWNPRHYLGKEMYAQWQDALATEEERTLVRDKRREVRQVRKERRIQRELQKEAMRKQLVEKESPFRRSKSSKGKGNAVVVEQGSKMPEKGGRGLKIAAKKITLQPSGSQRFSGSSNNGTPPAGGESSQAGDQLLGRSRNPSHKFKLGQQFNLSALSISPHGSPKPNQRVSLPGHVAAKPAGGGEAPPNTPVAGLVNRKPRHKKLLTRLGMRRPSSTDKLSDMGNSSAFEDKEERKLLTRLGMRRPSSTDKLAEMGNSSAFEDKEERKSAPFGLPLSPSMPMIAQTGSFAEPSNSSTANNPNESVFIDILDDNASSPRGERRVVSDDEEKGMVDESDLGIVI